ncbi:hypothetical protein ABZ726_06940 [Streptomyces hundungensis]|uniref:hypothetical protein n=1 Tax=Streptomyces hundungensis TaxID=1077946 RepID=UPI0033C4FC57
MPEPEPEPDLELLAAALRRDSEDLDLYARVLSASLADALPPDAVRVKRRRSFADRLAGRAGSVAELDVTLGERGLSLRMLEGRVVGEVRHEVRGVVLSRREVGLDEWVDVMARAVAEGAAASARAREAIERRLT